MSIWISLFHKHIQNNLLSFFLSWLKYQVLVVYATAYLYDCIKRSHPSFFQGLILTFDIDPTILNFDPLSLICFKSLKHLADLFKCTKAAPSLLFSTTIESLYYVDLCCLAFLNIVTTCSPCLFLFFIFFYFAEKHDWPYFILDFPFL